MLTAVFTDNGDGTYDLQIDGRVREYDVEEHDFHGALRRARFDGDDALVEDESGYRTPLTRR